MKPSQRARYAAAITLSKGKMYEYGVPEEDHLALPEDLDLESQFPLAVGTLGDFSYEVIQRAKTGNEAQRPTRTEDLVFAAQVLQAFDESYLNQSHSFELRLLASAAYYLADLPGCAVVQAKIVATLEMPNEDELARAVWAAIDKPWSPVKGIRRPRDIRSRSVLVTLRRHLGDGAPPEDVYGAIAKLTRWAYTAGSPHELLLADVLSAVAVTRISNSAWTLLPLYSELSNEAWQPYLKRERSIKEIWPSQRMLGEAGLYRGESGIVQMPTSAGKTRATELIIRSAFMAGRTKFAVVVAPFRALCQEISAELRTAFAEDGYQVNQLTDALQVDFLQELRVLFDIAFEALPHVIVLTPEKLLYVLRQEPKLIEGLGLIVYDEGHQFDTGPRGVTYELLLTSLKRVLDERAQTVLISAVIENATEVAKWLLSDGTKVVSDQRLQARRLVAFASLPEGKAGQLWFNVASKGEQEFFVPRVIHFEKLNRRERETADRVFPKIESGPIALYLALRQVTHGGVAIYTRSKLSAAKIVRDAVTEIFSRNVSLPAPSTSCDKEELRRLTKLYSDNFGLQSYMTKGAELGLFAHHANIPHGLRLAVEHAMRIDKIRLVICTSTLAQGVNLPIRYLFITSAMQGRDAIRPRDFHNLMGRAGRAGMHGEGTVVFTDHKLFDERNVKKGRWNDAIQLLSSGSGSSSGSTLLELIEPMRSDNGKELLPLFTAVELVTLLVNGGDGAFEFVENLSLNAGAAFSSNNLHKQLEVKRKTIEAIESYLMTYRGDVDTSTFILNSKNLARETLAYSLASPDKKAVLEQIFSQVAKRIDEEVPDIETQARFGRTLLGVDVAMLVEKWVTEHFVQLMLASSPNELFEELWPLLCSISSVKRLKDTAPVDAMVDLAKGWLSGETYEVLLFWLNSVDASYPYGKRRRKFDIDSLVGICEHAFAYEFALVIAAVKEAFVSFYDSDEAVQDFVIHVDLLQKRLKYGLPSQESISYFEAGFAERVVAQAVAAAVGEVAKTSSEAQILVRRYAEDVGPVVERYPSFFIDVFEQLTSS